MNSVERLQRLQQLNTWHSGQWCEHCHAVGVRFYRTVGRFDSQRLVCFECWQKLRGISRMTYAIPVKAGANEYSPDEAIGSIELNWTLKRGWGAFLSSLWQPLWQHVYSVDPVRLLSW